MMNHSNCNHPTCNGVCRRVKITKDRKPIKRVSEKQTVADKLYQGIKKNFMKQFPTCQVKDCTNPSTDIHHKAGRGRNYLNVATFLAVCRGCHRWIHDNDREARDLGYLENRIR